MTALPDPTRFDEVRDWMVNRDRSVVAANNLARFLRDNPDRLPELWSKLTQTAGRQIINAIDELETGELPVVRRLTGATSPTRGMVLAHSELTSTATLSDSERG